jgi:hypothetical protein
MTKWFDPETAPQNATNLLCFAEISDGAAGPSRAYFLMSRVDHNWVFQFPPSGSITITIVAWCKAPLFDRLSTFRRIPDIEVVPVNNSKSEDSK